VPVTMDTVTAVGTRISPGLSGRTRTVEVISRQRLERLPVRTLADALRWALSVDVMARSPAQADLSIRGSSYEQVLVLVDGVRASDPQTGHFDLNLAVPLEQIERIEIMHGPGSAIYGADAMGGVVNVVTRTAGPHMVARLEGGSFGTVAGALGGGGNIARTRVAGGVDYVRSDGYRDGVDYRIGQGSLAAETSIWSGQLTARAGHASREFGAADFYAPFPSYEETRTTTVGMSWRGHATPRLELRPVVHLRRHHDDFILRRAEPGFYRNEHTSTQVGAEAALRYRATGGLTLATGGEILHEDLESSSLGDRSEGRWALFGEALGVWGPVTIGAGVRGDRYENYGFALSPSVSVALQADEFRVRGLVGRSFRAPSWTERFYEDPANRGRQDLDPERAWAAEVGADMWLLGGAELSVSAFGRKALGLIDWARRPDDAMAVWETRNVKTATFRGLEAKLRGMVVVGADIAIQGSVVSVSVGEAEGLVSKYALRPLIREVSVSVSRGLGPAVAESQLKYRRREAEDGYWLMDLRFALPGLSGAVYVDVLNVLDAEYQLITGASAPGRSVMVGVRVGSGG